MVFEPWLTAVSKTPLWVWLTLLYMIYVGMRALRPQVVYPPTLLLVPAVLMAFKFPIFFSKAPHLYLSMLGFGFVIGLIAAAKTRIISQKFPHRLILPGGPSTLIVLLGFFCIKYHYGLLHAIDPEQASRWAWLDTSVSGLLPGYSWAKGLFFSYCFFRPWYKIR
jgi:hypothetical protein